ncbi:MAG: hypothetical protein QME58_06350 [Bacteroidota bacterium]|nr:hypothetical protein [Bacteroidota bacterium]
MWWRFESRISINGYADKKKTDESVWGYLVRFSGLLSFSVIVT